MTCRLVREAVIIGLIAGLVFASGCNIFKQATPEIRIVEVENQNSELLRLLIQPTDFDDDWQLIASSISQKSVIPTNENHFWVETALHYMSGDIQIIHDLWKYQNRVDWIEPITFSRESVAERNLEILPPKVGNHVEAKCIEERPLSTNTPPAGLENITPEIRCRVLVQYDYLISRITIYSLGHSFEDLKILLEATVLKIDSRIIQQKQ